MKFECIGIIVIQNNDAVFVGTEQCSVRTVKMKSSGRYGLLSKIVKSFKEACVKDFHGNFQNDFFAWQRSFYDHIIRDETSLNAIREYIQTNPLRWMLDRQMKNFLHRLDAWIRNKKEPISGVLF